MIRGLDSSEQHLAVMSRWRVVPQQWWMAGRMPVTIAFHCWLDEVAFLVNQLTDMMMLLWWKQCCEVSNNVLIKVTLSRQRHCRGTVKYLSYVLVLLNCHVGIEYLFKMLVNETYCLNILVLVTAVGVTHTHTYTCTPWFESTKKLYSYELLYIVWVCFIFLQNAIRYTTYRRLFSTAPMLAAKQVYIWVTL